MPDPTWSNKSWVLSSFVESKIRGSAGWRASLAGDTSLCREWTDIHLQSGMLCNKHHTKKLTTEQFRVDQTLWYHFLDHGAPKSEYSRPKSYKDHVSSQLVWCILDYFLFRPLSFFEAWMPSCKIQSRVAPFIGYAQRGICCFASMLRQILKWRDLSCG